MTTIQRTIRQVKIQGPSTACALICIAFLTSLCCPIAIRTATAQALPYRGAREPATAAEVYGQGVRETTWLSPMAEQAGFHLPDGFFIELFASEPQIAKPLNMAWDARGRLWVTSSREYPYPAAADAVARDTIQILEDTDGDGRADKSTTFADGLNIPIGVLPVSGGAICFSIPNLWLLRDTDGDDRADERIKLLGPFDTSRDTHGMVNSLHRGSDGWIYACHGFSNQSDVTATDGSRVQLNSGNTFRFKEDGSRIEQVTSGQVNPFGVTRDEWGNWYSADCHSKPLTALLPGACYPSFGRPHDGLGFGPAMMDHLHGSTAICGLLYYQAEQFPAAYRQRFYSGNVMTSRINCNELKWDGSTASAKELPDFLTSDDPWFRPVDIQLGPDGAMYVADFYNKIIGHYEVPLEHPGRDRESGRIWRISYRGPATHASAEPLQIKLSEIRKPLANTNITRRELAVAAAMPEKELSSADAREWLHDSAQSEELRLSCLEVLFRRGDFASHAVPIAADSAAQRLLVQQIALAADLPAAARAEYLQFIRGSIPYLNPQAQRAACRLLGLAGDAHDIQSLAALVAGGRDLALQHTARIAIRQILRDDSQLATATATATWDAGNQAAKNARPEEFKAQAIVDGVVADILPAVGSALAAQRLLDYVAARPEAKPQLVESAIGLATKHPSDALLEQLLEILKPTKARDLVGQTQQFELVCTAYLGQHKELPGALRRFGQQLQQQLLEDLTSELSAQGTHLSWVDQTRAEWATEKRKTAAGGEAELRSSFTRGERYTGKLVSEAFVCPNELRFWIAGHNGAPGESDQQLNSVQLQLVASGLPLHTAWPPRSDVAQQVTWELGETAGQQVRLVIADGDSGDAYAWLAVGQFSMPQLNPSTTRELLESYRQLLQRGLAPLDAKSVDSLPLSPIQRGELIAAGLKGSGREVASLLAGQALKLDRSDLVTSQLLDTEASSDTLAWSKQIAATATSPQQRELTRGLTQSAEGCKLLKQLLDDGALSVLSLQNLEVLWPRGLADETRLALQGLCERANQSEPTSAGAAVARLANLDWTKADVALGQQLYQQHCAVCHQLRGVGNVVGPQLDGAVVRGVERMCEDILEPNTNVDKAFRVSALLLDDDSVLTGLVRDEVDGTVVVTGSDGKTKQFPASRITERRDSALSLMPANFGELLNDEQLVALLEYLVRQP